MQAARNIIARLSRQGLAVVDVRQAQAVQALAGLDAILDLPTDDEDLVREWASQMGMDNPAGLFAALAAVRAVLDAPPPIASSDRPAA